MASCNARRDSDSRPPGYSYLDGVPVKIGEKFRLPRKVTLPLSYQQRYPVDLLNEDYDFSLENQVLELANTKRRGKEALERAKAEKLASTIEDFTRLACEDDFWTTRVAPGLHEKQDGGEPGSGSTAGASNGLESSSTTPRAATMEPNTMLKPIPLESGSATAKPDVTMIASAELNLADFESESSPFDSIALKTLDDLEELKSVLQNSNVSDGQLRSFRRADSDASAGQETRFAVGPPLGAGTTNSTLNFSAVPIPAPTAHHQDVIIGISSMTSSGVGARSLPSPQVVFAHPAASAAAAVNTPSSKCSPSEDGMYATLVPLRNSRSTPDLLRELGVALAAERARKKQATSMLGDQRPSGTSGLIAEEKELFDDHGKDEGERNASCTKSSKAMDEGGRFKSSENSRLASNSPPADHQQSLADVEVDSQALVNHITDMGFPRSRVARAVHKLGADYKKIVEYLCMVQSFVEAGHSAEDAEMALFLHDHNEAEAKKFLELMSQFKDLGFDVELIQKALLQSNNERDKALDLLVSL